jgi:hypothetical protein
MSDSEAVVSGVDGTVGSCTDRSRDGEAVDGTLTLAGWTGAVVIS